MKPTLGSLCKFLNGGTPPKSESKFFEGNIPWITSADITSPIVDSARSYITDEAVTASATNKVTAGTALLVTRTGVGKVAIAGVDLCFSQDITAILPDHNLLDNSYLVHFLRTKKDYLLSMARGATIKGVTRNVVADLEIPLYPLPEQRRIAAVLDKADALRAKRREALAQFDHLAQSIFVEMFGDFKQDLHRWPIEPLGAVAVDMKIGLVRSSEEFGDDAKFDIPYVRMNAIGRCGDFFPDLVQRTTVTPKELSDYRLQMGDILFNTRNSKELVGKTAIFRGTGNYVYNNNLMRIRFDQRVNAEYAAHCFLTPFIQQELEMRKSGTTSVFAIYGRDLSTLPLPIPPASLQKKFASRVACIQKMRTRIQISASETTRLFASLQHHAFQGEL